MLNRPPPLVGAVPAQDLARPHVASLTLVRGGVRAFAPANDPIPLDLVARAHRARNEAHARAEHAADRRAALYAQAQRLRDALDSVAGLSPGPRLGTGFVLGLAAKLADDLIDCIEGRP